MFGTLLEQFRSYLNCVLNVAFHFGSVQVFSSKSGNSFCTWFFLPCRVWIRVVWVGRAGRKSLQYTISWHQREESKLMSRSSHTSGRLSLTCLHTWCVGLLERSQANRSMKQQSGFDVEHKDPTREPHSTSRQDLDVFVFTSIVHIIHFIIAAPLPLPW